MNQELKATSLPTYLKTLYLAEVDRRKFMRDIVLVRLKERGVASGLRGSWRNGDFHMSSGTCRTFSDVDILLTGANHSRCERVKADLTRAFVNFLSIKVSVHPDDYLGAMTLVDSRILNVAECVAALRRTKDRNARNYSRAKTALLLSRNSQEEKYIQVARRHSKEATWRVFGVKLGLIDKACTQTIRDVVLSSSDQREIRMWFVKECLNGVPDRDSVEELSRKLESAVSIDNWLKKHMFRKLAREQE